MGLEQPDQRPAGGGSGLLTFWNQPGLLLITNRKLPAIAYIDDRAIPFRSWPQAVAQLAGLLDTTPAPDPAVLPLLEAAERIYHRPACCDMHNIHCEPPADLCCAWCAEAKHPNHLPGQVCVLQA